VPLPHARLLEEDAGVDQALADLERELPRPVATVAQVADHVDYVREVAGVDHVGLGSDFDGAVPVPFDVTGMALVVDALLVEGFADDDIAAVMGGNALRLLSAALPGR
jgi:microsomal dipeptidase-like Zn-dependent dipeptidase